MASAEQDILTFLDRVLSKEDVLDEANREINRICSLFQNGYSPGKIQSRQYRGNLLEFIFEIAKSRLLVSDKFSKSHLLWLDRYSASYSTPEIVGKYRSKRLSGNSIVDMGCGAGMQTVMFAKHSQVTGVEIDPVRSRLAKLNASAYHRENIQILNEDCMESKYRLNPEDLIFSDPLRSAGRGEKTMSTLVPDPTKILEQFEWQERKYAFDLPPTMPLSNIPLEGEREFISINGRVNRLTVYSPDLSHSERTAVILPANLVIHGEVDSAEYEGSRDMPALLSIPDVSLLYSELLNRAFDPETFHLFSKDRRRIVLGSDVLPEDRRTGEFFEVISETEQGEIRSSLEKLQPAKVYPRFEIPSGEYYDYVRSISDPLWIGESLYLFRKGKRYILARKLETQPNVKNQ